MRRKTLACSVLLWCPLLALAQPAAPKFTARLYAAHESIQPGGQTQLIVELDVEKGWYAYHPVILDTGAPTRVEFQLPPGAAIEDVRYPIPVWKKEQAEDLTLEYLSLSGKVRVVATLKLGDGPHPDTLEIAAHVRALVCKKVCVAVDAEAALRLPVSPDQPRRANEALFKDALAALPRKLADAEYLEGSRLLVSHQQVPVGGRAALVAVLNVKPGHHIWDRNPGAKGLVPTRLYIESRDGVQFDRDRPVWPQPKTVQVPGVGRAYEHSGQVVIQSPFEINDQEFEPGRVRLGVLVEYQSCDDAGTCFPPTMAEGAVEFEVVPAGAPAVKNDDPILASLSAPPAGGSVPTGRAATPAGPATDLLLVFLAAFVGGAILNVMPCVLPVISLKIFGFVQQAGDDRGRIFRMGLVYAAGILASFGVLAAIMVTAGMAWGGLMQQPGFLIGLSAVLFAFALSLLGVFELQLPGLATNIAGKYAGREGYGGAFVNGILTTLLATPCVGPFLGSAVGVLTQLPPLTAGAGIMTVGLGLAVPYVLLTAFPGWLRFLPRPGPWMVTFKQVVGFVLVAVVLWLLSILVHVVEAGQLLATLGLLLAVGLGCWVLGRMTLGDSPARSAALWLLALGFMAGGGYGSFWLFGRHASAIPWQKWEPGIGRRLAADGYTVYIDYTAKWCLTCQANKVLVLERAQVAREFAQLGVYPILADFTNYDPQMLAELEEHERKGVPLNVIYPAGRPAEPIVLPEVLRPGLVREALRKAGPSSRPPAFWDKGS